MSHRRVCSQGSIPFSWEDKPGISKAAKLEYHPRANDYTAPPPSKQQPPHRNSLSGDHPEASKSKNIPLPPCPALSQPPSRSSSGKGLKWQPLNHHQDPFLIAYKECTKPAKNGKRGSNGKAKKKSVFTHFSCKGMNSCDVVNSNPQLPSLPRHKYQSLTMDNW